MEGVMYALECFVMVTAVVVSLIFWGVVAVLVIGLVVSIFER